MVDIVKALGWEYVSTVADEGNYGEKGIGAFEHLAKKEGICISSSLRIPREHKEDTFYQLLRDLSRNAKARTVVMFVNEDNIRLLLAATIHYGMEGTFSWLASDSWGSKLYPIFQQESAAEGAVTILPLKQTLKDFDKYFMNLGPFEHTVDPWFMEFWEQHFRCTFGQNITGVPRGRCTGKEIISRETSGYTQEGLVPFVVDAVYAMAYALQSLHKERCGAHEKVCSRMLPLAGPALLSHIRNTSFVGTAGSPVRFNEVGDAMGRYTIYQFQRRPDDKYEYVQVGNWTEKLYLDQSMLQWRNGSKTPPKSVCSEPCPNGYVRNSNGLNSCCWACIRCGMYEIMKDEYNCMECPNGSLPHENKTFCEQLPVHYMQLDGPWAIVPAIVAALGIVSTIFVTVVFIKYNKTPVIMASGRELCYVLLFGFGFCYSMTFAMVTKPSTLSCIFLRAGLGLSLSICYSALFTKTNRISRIFNRGIKAMVKRPSYTSPRSQLVICGCLVSIQVMGATTWLAMEPPGTRLEYPERETVVLRCHSTNFAIVVSLLYNMFLIILCTVYAFKTRKIPENYNEAKYIAFTMYSTCIVWLAFIPIYFGTKNDFKIQNTALCMCVSISATVALGCLFAPKVYIVLFQPHKNVRQSVASALNPTANRHRTLFGRQSSRFGALNGNVTSPSNVHDSAASDQESSTFVLSTLGESHGPDNSEAEVSADSADECLKHERLTAM